VATVDANVGTGHGSRAFDVLQGIEGQPVPHEVTALRPGDPVSRYADPTFTESSVG
jgi:UDP-glucose 4-epimerase